MSAQRVSAGGCLSRGALPTGVSAQGEVSAWGSLLMVYTTPLGKHNLSVTFVADGIYFGKDIIE